MIRTLGPLLRTLPIAAILTFAAFAPAQAANEAQSGPLQGLMGLFQHEAQAQPLSRDRIESDALPPPGFATPNGGPPPVADPMAPQTGHQFGAQAPTAQAAPASATPMLIRKRCARPAMSAALPLAPMRRSAKKP